MKKYAMLMIGLLLMLSLSGCSNRIPSPPDTSRILKDIPAEMATIDINGEALELSIDNLSIDRRQTNEKDDLVFCVLSMSNDEYQFEAYYRVVYTYFDQGGWLMERYDKYEEPVLSPKSGISKNRADGIISNSFTQFNLLSDLFDPSSNSHVFTYSIDEEHFYCSYGGTVDVIYSFFASGHTGEWKYRLDDSNLMVNWDIVGLWYADNANSGYGLNLKINSFDNTTVDVEAVCLYKGSEINSFGNKMDFVGNCKFIELESSSQPEKPYKRFTYTIRPAGSALYDVRIFSDSAIVYQDRYAGVELQKMN